VLGLQAFNVVLAGTGFPVQQVQVQDFVFNGHHPKVEIQVSQALQAGVDEYSIQVVSERFQVTATAGKATQHRIQAITTAAATFAQEYAGKRAISAVGHNFSGSFASPLGSASTFMQHIAWRDDFAAAIASEDEPVLSLTTRFRRGDQTGSVIRLEPLAGDDAKVFYDLNFSWGAPGEPLPFSVSELLERYPDSLAEASKLIEDLAALGTKGRGL
jgi:hypothetical protein